jgi:hypothetical protein
MFSAEIDLCRAARQVSAVGVTMKQGARNSLAHLYQRKGFRSAGQGRGALGIAMRNDLRTRVAAQSKADQPRTSVVDSFS